MRSRGREDRGAIRSAVRAKNAAGQDVGLMHACGRDLHIMSLLGTAQALAHAKDPWSGTLMLAGQPAVDP